MITRNISLKIKILISFALLLLEYCPSDLKLVPKCLSFNSEYFHMLFNHVCVHSY